jgi:hypothetical protein
MTAAIKVAPIVVDIAFAFIVSSFVLVDVQRKSYQERCREDYLLSRKELAEQGDT